MPTFENILLCITDKTYHEIYRPSECSTLSYKMILNSILKVNRKVCRHKTLHGKNLMHVCLQRILEKVNIFSITTNAHGVARSGAKVSVLNAWCNVKGKFNPPGVRLTLQNFVHLLITKKFHISKVGRI